MSDLVEVLFTSEAAGEASTICVLDPHTGSNLMYYKGGGPSNQHGINLIRNEFVVSVNASKPLLHMWLLNNEEQIMNKKFVLPGKASCVAVSKDGNYCIAGIAENLYVWQIVTGKLLAVLSKHFQLVTVIKFLDDGFHFISGGKDGKVFVWNLTETINRYGSSQIVPLYTFSDNTLPLTDMFIGNGGLKALLGTVSLDRVLNVYSLYNGEMLLNLIFPNGLTSITIDKLEKDVYIGSITGHIYNVSIVKPNRMKEYHLENSELSNSFKGHEGAVTCLSLSLNGLHLVSGGADGKIIIWHITSKQIVRILAHKSPITNVFYALTPSSIFHQEIKLNLIINNFQRMIDNQTNADITEVLVSENGNEQINESTPVIFLPSLISDGSEIQDKRIIKNEIKHVKAVNRDLYQLILQKILK